MSRLTCITCQVGFTDQILHREHFKGDWHRYNLKRKVANLSVVSAAEFEARKDAHEAQAKVASGEVKDPGNYCIACRKSFTNKKAYDNHINSKKHKELVLQFDDEDVQTIRQKIKNKDSQTQQVVEEEMDDEDLEMEEVDSDEWEDYEDEPLPITDCLFCSHHSANLDNNLKHMLVTHSFFLPDPEYLSDVEGLMEYLGAKVGQGHMCLWCNERGKTFRTLDAVQKHMVDLGHCKLKHEGEALLEYDEYYDYSSSYPEEEDGVDKDMEVDIKTIDDSGFNLVLPSGAVIGHRSLMRYYKQSLNPNRALVTRDRSSGSRVFSAYKALGWTGTSVDAAARAKDIKYMKRLENKHQLKLGWKANKLQTHFRDRNGMC